MSEKRVLIAALLSAIFLTLYSQMFIGRIQPLSLKSGQVPEAIRDTKTTARTIQHLYEEDVTSIESDAMSLVIGQKSGAIRQVELKRFLESGGATNLKLGSALPLFQILIDGKSLSWKLVKTEGTSLTLESTDSSEHYYILYSIDSSNGLINMEVSKANVSEKLPEITIAASWSRADQLTSRQNVIEAFISSENGRGGTDYKRYVGPLKSEKIVPRGTWLISLSERYFCELIKPIGSTAEIHFLPSEPDAIVVEGVLRPRNSSDKWTTAAVKIYVGPRDFFYLRNTGLESAFPIGILGKIGLIMLTFLSWLGGLVGNYGIAIIIFSGVVTGLMAPFTLLGLRSMKKMQELKPRVDRIMAQHKDDKQRANQELFALYKEHKVSPLSGCLPMFIQFPVFIALFQAISHYVELRGRSFLWIKDLSLPDHIAKLPFSLPILGEHINMLPVIMAAAMFAQTKLSQAKMAVDQNNPTAKMMSGPMMSILFGVMFYQFPSGLVLYWLTNSLFSLAVYKTATS